MGRASKIMAPTSCFSGQVHRLPDSPEAYGAMITRPMAAPAQSRSADLEGHGSLECYQQQTYRYGGKRTLR